MPKPLLFIVAVLGTIVGCQSVEHQPAPQPTPVRVYVSNERSGDVSVIDPETNRVVATIPVGKRPRGIRLSRDNQTLFIALSGSPIAGPGVDTRKLPPADKSADGIGVVDVRTGRFVQKIDSGSDPEQFSLSNDERFLYVSNEDVAQASIIDLKTAEIVKVLEVAEEPEGVCTSPDGRLVYVTCETQSEVHVIDTATRSVIARIKTSERPRSVAFLPDGSKAYVTCETAGAISVIDVANHKLLRDIRPPGQNVRPMGIALSPSGNRAYVTTGRGRSVVEIDTTSDCVGRILPDVGTRPWGIGITPDGKFLYTANGPSDDVTVIELSNFSIKNKTTCGHSPWGIAISN